MTRNRITGLVLAVTGIIVFILTMGIKTWIDLGEPGPKLFPVIGSVGLFICGVGVFFQKEAENREPFLTKKGWMNILYLMIAMVLYVIVIYYVGFLIPTPFFLFAMINILAGKAKRPKLVNSITVSLVLSFGLYFIFTNLLKIVLPAGKLF